LRHPFSSYSKARKWNLQAKRSKWLTSPANPGRGAFKLFPYAPRRIGSAMHLGLSEGQVSHILWDVPLSAVLREFQVGEELAFLWGEKIKFVRFQNRFDL